MRDASVDLAAGGDASGGSDADGGPVVAPLALEFSATGCQSFDDMKGQCSGQAPLSLQFTPLATSGLMRFQWSFGDGTAASTEMSPTHAYVLPGTYTVSLAAGGSAGTVTQVHAAYVRVVEVAPGGVCDVEAQCQQGASCWCGAAAPCSPLLTRGFCAVACSADGEAACATGTTCVDLSRVGPVASPPAAGSPWGRMLCLQSCVDETTCPAGARCRTLPSAAAAGMASGSGAVSAWARACFWAYPFDIGTRCDSGAGASGAGASGAGGSGAGGSGAGGSGAGGSGAGGSGAGGSVAGASANADCASGLCASLGRYGRCSLDCSAVDCPQGTACAGVPDGRRLCVALCSDASPCDDDPLLACQVAGQAGDGFAIAPSPSPTATSTSPTDTYCAPKPCGSALDCGPAGVCPPGGGRCAAVVAGTP